MDQEMSSTSPVCGGGGHLRGGDVLPDGYLRPPGYAGNLPSTMVVLQETHANHFPHDSGHGLLSSHHGSTDYHGQYHPHHELHDSYLHNAHRRTGCDPYSL